MSQDSTTIKENWKNLPGTMTSSEKTYFAANLLIAVVVLIGFFFGKGEGINAMLSSMCGFFLLLLQPLRFCIGHMDVLLHGRKENVSILHTAAHDNLIVRSWHLSIYVGGAGMLFGFGAVEYAATIL